VGAESELRLGVTGDREHACNPTLTVPKTAPHLVGAVSELRLGATGDREHACKPTLTVPKTAPHLVGSASELRLGAAAASELRLGFADDSELRLGVAGGRVHCNPLLAVLTTAKRATVSSAPVGATPELRLGAVAASELRLGIASESELRLGVAGEEECCNWPVIGSLWAGGVVCVYVYLRLT
jgi:hypothetical protein